MLVEDELDRVMPSRRCVMDAGRYDLHHAIQYHGGYTLVTHPAPLSECAQMDPFPVVREAEYFHAAVISW